MLFCSFSTSAAAGRASQEFRRHYDQGMRLYGTGQLEGAIEEFQAAYAVKQLPRLLYNLARAHFQLGHARQSLDLYRQYLLLEPEPPPEIRTRVQDDMAQAQAMLDAAERMKAAPPRDPLAPSHSAAPPSGNGPASSDPSQRPAPTLGRPPAQTTLSGKAGPILLGARAGAAVPLALFSSGGDGIVNATSLPTEIAVSLEVGFALNAARTVYLVIPPQVQIERINGSVTGTWIMAPLGIQIDIPIRAVRGLFLYPRLAVGYVAGIFSDVPSVHMGLALPEFGIKYVVKERVNLGFEPFSMPILFTSKAVLLFYRPMFYVGVNL